MILETDFTEMEMTWLFLSMGTMRNDGEQCKPDDRGDQELSKTFHGMKIRQLFRKLVFLTSISNLSDMEMMTISQKLVSVKGGTPK